MSVSLINRSNFFAKNAAKGMLAPIAEMTSSNVLKFSLAPKPTSSLTTTDRVKQLQREQEKNDAKKFAMSVAALLNSKQNPGLFMVPKAPVPKPTSEKSNTPQSHF